MRWPSTPTLRCSRTPKFQPSVRWSLSFSRTISISGRQVVSLEETIVGADS